MYLTRFRTQKIALPPQTKTLEGRRPQTDKHLPSTFTGKFFRKADINGLVPIEIFGSWFSDLRFPFTMFTLQTSFKPFLMGGGWGVKSVSRGDCEWKGGKL